MSPPSTTFWIGTCLYFALTFLAFPAVLWWPDVVALNVWIKVALTVVMLPVFVVGFLFAVGWLLDRHERWAEGVREEMMQLLEEVATASKLGDSAGMAKSLRAIFSLPDADDTVICGKERVGQVILQAGEPAELEAIATENNPLPVLTDALQACERCGSLMRTLGVGGYEFHQAAVDCSQMNESCDYVRCSIRRASRLAGGKEALARKLADYLRHELPELLRNQSRVRQMLTELEAA